MVSFELPRKEASGQSFLEPFKVANLFPGFV